MEVIIFIGLVAVGLVIFYQWNKQDVPADVVKTEQEPAKEQAPYKVETPAAAQDIVPQPVVAIADGVGAVTAPAPKKAAAKKTAAKKTAAKKTAAAKKPAGKKKSA